MDLSYKRQDIQLFVSPDILAKSSGDGFFFRAVVSYSLRFCKKSVIDNNVSRHIAPR
jgi:hypothetical protein